MHDIVVFVNTRRTPLEAMAAVMSANRLGLDVALITDQDPAIPVQALHSVHRMDTYDVNHARPVVVELVKSLGARGVTTWSDRDVSLVADVASELSLPGCPPAAARNARSKLRMRLCVARHHPNYVPPFAEVVTREDLDRALATVGLPAILKPVGGAGSKGIFTIGTRGEAEAAYSRLVALTEPAHDRTFSEFPRQLIYEGVLGGSEHSVEGVVARGRVHVAGITDKEVTSPFHIEYLQSHPSSLPSHAQAQVVQMARAVVGDLGIDNCAFHLELKWDSASGPRMLECAARPGGGFIASHLLPLSTGIPLQEWLIATCVGEDLPRTSAEIRTRYAVSRQLLAHRAGVFDGFGSALYDALSVPGLQHFIPERKRGAAVELPPEDFTSLVLASVVSQGTSAELARASAGAVAALLPGAWR